MGKQHAEETSGYVYTLQGTLVQGAIVQTGSARFSTGADGAFAFRGLPEGIVELSVEAEGLVPARPLLLAGERDVTVTLYETGTERRDRRPRPSPDPAGGPGTISGVVRVNGKALGNAPVTVESKPDDLSLGAQLTVCANAKGEFRATGLPLMQYAVLADARVYPRLLSVHSRWYKVGEVPPYIVDLRKSHAATMDVDLFAAPMIRGRVTDAAGKPVPRARVEAVPVRYSTVDFTLDRNLFRTAPDGRFSITSPAWDPLQPVTLAVTPPLEGTSRSRPFLLSSGDQEIEVTLARTEAVRVRVRNAAGNPVANARVATVGSEDLNTMEGVDILVAPGYGQRADRTSADGELVLQLAPGLYTFVAGATGLPTVRLARDVRGGSTVDLVLGPNPTR
ncbi:MAG: carboxypeptidase regulatory-like domain-containing protein [Thermoanaerobaculia bacterium]